MPAGADHLNAGAPRSVPVAGDRDVRHLVAEARCGESGERANPRLHLAQRLFVEAGDHVRQVSPGGAAAEARVQAVGDDDRRSEHRRGQRDASRAQQAPRPALAEAAARLIPNASHLSRPSAISRTRSAAAAISGSWVTMTTARLRAVMSRSRRRRSRAAVRIEVPGRLVGEHQRGVVDQRPGDREALLLAAGELVWQVLRDRTDTELGDQLPSTFSAAARCSRETGRQQHVLFAAALGDQLERLKDEADPSQADSGEAALRAARQQLPADGDLTRVRPVERSEQMKKCRLARPRPSQDRDQLARVNLDIDPGEHPAGRPPRADALRHPMGLEDGHRATVTRLPGFHAGGRSRWRSDAGRCCMRSSGLEPPRGKLPTRPSTSYTAARCFQQRPDRPSRALSRTHRTYMEQRVLPRRCHAKRGSRAGGPLGAVQGRLAAPTVGFPGRRAAGVRLAGSTGRAHVTGVKFQ